MGFSFEAGSGEVSKQPEIKNAQNGASEVGEQLRERFNGVAARLDALVETICEPYFTSYVDRLSHTPAGAHASFEGIRGESKCVPNLESEKGRAAAEKLEQYGCDGIEFRDAIPDYSPCAEAIVQIDHMGTERLGSLGNFNQAYEKVAEQWNASEREGRSDWKPSDVRQWRLENNLTVHECSDRKTCMFVDRDIHDAFSHSGGVSECIHREGQKLKGAFYDLFDR